MGLRVFRAEEPPTVADVRELKAFLDSFSADDEKSLQHLLERHPSLIGVLGFSDFLSEAPIYKPNADNEPDLSDLRRRDRADLIAARTSPLLSSYRFANIIELKGATRPIGDRSVGFRLSKEASEAVEQLHEYRSWLTTIPQNRALLKSLKWDVRWPTLSLIMGRRLEFSSNPGQFEEIKSRLIGKEVNLYTVDDVLERAVRHVEQRIVPPSVVEWFSAPASLASPVSLHLAGAVISRLGRALAIAAEDPSSLASMPPRAFEELVAAVYRLLGYSTERNALTRDNGVDIVARRQNPGVGEVTIVVQCRQFRHDRAVGPEDVRQLAGAALASGLTQGALVTTGIFSQGAKQLAASLPHISLVDRARLMEMVRQVLEQGNIVRGALMLTPEEAGYYVTDPSTTSETFHQSLCRKCGSNRIKSVYVRIGMQGELNHYVDCENCGFSELLGMEY